MSAELNQKFLKAVKKSFKTYLEKDTSRSTAKLKKLHGRIAKDLQEQFGSGYKILSQGFGDDREGTIHGKYYPKNVDITVCKNGDPVAGYAVKFVMRNYSQNSNNYFENMLGETANIRGNGIPYFHVFIIFEQVPYYKAGGAFAKYDILTQHNLDKYIELSEDDPSMSINIPDKTLIVILRLKEKSHLHPFKDSKDYAKYYLSVIDDSDIISYSENFNDVFGDGVILNNYEKFIKETVYIAKEKERERENHKNNVVTRKILHILEE